MSTLSEFLKLEKNQAIVLDRIVETLRTSGSWGKRGLFVKVANDTGFSAAYVGQVLTGKKPLTDEFVCKIADYLKVSVAYLRGYNEGIEIKSPLDDRGLRLYDYIKNGIRVRLNNSEVETIGLCYLECRKTGDMSMVENYIKKLESRNIPDHLL